MMKPAAFFLMNVLVCTVALAQSAAAPALNDFAGTWTAEFHKQVWMRLTLTADKGTLAGTLEHSTQISADNEGDITKVDEEMTTDNVVKVELNGDTLQIETKDPDGDTDRYRMALTGKDAAELRAVTADGTVAPKPFKLKRAVSSTQK